MSARFASFVLATALSGGTLVTAPALACGETTQAPDKAVPADAAKVVIPVQGMSCGGCATAIHNALLKLDGVFTASVDYEKGTAEVAFDKAKVTVDALVKAIDGAGFKATKPSA